MIAEQSLSSIVGTKHLMSYQIRIITDGIIQPEATSENRSGSGPALGGAGRRDSDQLASLPDRQASQSGDCQRLIGQQLEPLCWMIRI